MRTLIALMIITKVALAPVYAQKPPIVSEVRKAIDAGNFAEADKILAAAEHTPAWLEAYSWMARGHLFRKEYKQADEYAVRTRHYASEMLKTRKLDDEPSLPLALGASIEVQSQVLNANGQKAEAVDLLQREIKTWQGTSIVTRLHKNLNLISLVGKPAPSFASHDGKKVLLFFWAHWCGDCKASAGIVARLGREFPSVKIVGPTQTYGYVAGGEDAPRDKELAYIEEVRKKYYANIPGMLAPVSEKDFQLWGASTTPTFALIDAKGIVRLYHPGKMTYEELLPYVRD